MKKLMHVSFDMGFTTMLQTACKNVILVKDEVVNVENAHSVPVSSHVMKQVGLDLCSLSWRWMGTTILLSLLIISLNGQRPKQSEMRQL